MALLRLADVTKRYEPGGPPAVEGLTLAVASGHILALLGPSGCGKTTTLRLVAGFEAPDAGAVTIGERVMADPGRGVFVPPEQRGVGIVFQDYALFPHLTVEANVAFGLRGRPRQSVRDRVRQVLDLVGLGSLGARYPHELSGGQQQRVAVARALAPAPALILLDEPFSSLDADLRGQMRDEVTRVLRATDTTAVFVTHDREEAFTIADAVGVLNGGHLEQVGPPEAVYHQPATPFVAGFVGEADFLPGTVTAEGVVSEIGVFPNVAGYAEGDRVRVMIRPDDVTFAPDERGIAVVSRRDFRGPETLYRLRLPSGQEVHSSQPSAASLPAGIRVRAEANVLHVVTFPEAPAAR